MKALSTVKRSDESISGSTKPFLTLSQVATILDFDIRTVALAIKRRQIPAIELGKRTLVPRRALEILIGADR